MAERLTDEQIAELQLTVEACASLEEITVHTGEIKSLLDEVAEGRWRPISSMPPLNSGECFFVAKSGVPDSVTLVRAEWELLDYYTYIEIDFEPDVWTPMPVAPDSEKGGGDE